MRDLTKQPAQGSTVFSTSRRLLQTAATPMAQYCYPTGACDLSNLHEGLSGFVLLGEGDYQYSGYSVANAGDINGDGFVDLLVGAPYASPAGQQTGKTYVVFGSNQINAWGSGVLDLSSLMDGQRGFVLQGEAFGYYSGWSVSSAGDINGDGLADLLVGAWGSNGEAGASYAGKSYVVFGSNQTNAWGSGVLNLINLMDGQRGFMLQGEAVEDASGYSVSSAGDINSDGFSDVLVGAPYADPSGFNSVGKTYVVFGSNQTNAWGSGVLDLRNLMNGQRGFVLQGDIFGYYSGASVSSAGDINGDGFDDVVIGAYGDSPTGRPGAGKIYVVFGSNQTSAWGSGILNLTSLMNGQRGFVLQGEVAYDRSGWFVNDLGDINGDSISDLVLSALNTDVGISDAGKSYVVFGSNHTNAWGSGVLDLTSLMNGQRGFKLLGEAAGDQSGYSVSGAGDINGDGFADLLVGAEMADSAGPANRTDAGKTYVVLGSNEINAWGSGILNLSSLMDGRRGFVLQGEAAFDYSGLSTSSAGDINRDGFADIFVGAYYADIGAGKSYVVFGGRSAQLWVNELTLYRGQTLTLSNQNLNATDTKPVQFNIVAIDHGRFEYVTNPGQSISLFNQSDVWQGQIQFVHDGSSNPPSYTVQMGSGIAKLFQNATINFFGFGNRLTIHQGESLWMGPAYLDIVSSYQANQTDITITDLQHGQFLLAPSNTSTLQFTQMELLSGNILFAHDGSVSAPSYNVTITDPSRNVTSAAEVTFYRRPAWYNNQLALTQGDQIILSNRHINITEDQSPNNVLLIISNLQHGKFKLLPLNNTATQFTQQQLLAGQVLFAHDKTGLAPTYQLTLNDGYFVLPPQSASINFTALPPILNTNRLTALQGRAIPLSAADLNATDPDPLLNDTFITFTVSNVQYGQFTLNGSSVAVIQFTQAQVKQGQVWFTQNDSTTAPSYQVAASNSYRSTSPTAADVFFDKRPLLINNRLTLETGESVVLSLSNLQAVDDHTASADLLFNIYNVNNGYFSQLQSPSIGITSFLQQQVRDFELQFTHDGSSNPPSYMITASDASGLSSYKAGAQINFKDTTSVGVINLQQLYTSVSSAGGIFLGIAGYLWWRRKLTNHRRGYELANNLRKAANLEYHDFTAFDGDIYKNKVENLSMKIDGLQKGFYKSLNSDQKKNFAVCLAEILEQHRLLSPSGYGMGLYGWILAFSVGWSQQLNFKQFEDQLDEIAQEAITAWRAEENPTTRWPYFSPTCKDKMNAFCCARPSRAGMFAQDRVRISRSQDVSMTEIKQHHMPKDTDEKISITETKMTSSPRLYGENSASSGQELVSLIKREMQSELKPLTGQVQQLSGYMQQSLYVIDGNFKKLSNQVGVETQSLLPAQETQSNYAQGSYELN